MNSNFRALADVRFKLLALIPTIGGTAIYLLSKFGFAISVDDPMSTAKLIGVGVASLIGFAATLGLAVYDQRNSQIYNALAHRATYLERSFGSPHSEGSLRKPKIGGQFNERPKDPRCLFWTIPAKHDLGLALIYGPILSFWWFPILNSILRIAGVDLLLAQLISVACALAASFVSTFSLTRLDSKEISKYRDAWDRDAHRENRPKQWEEGCASETNDGLKA